MSAPKVSIVTITYNQEKYIRAALDGFIAQKTNFDFEVIVADDCSTDGTAKIIEEYAANYPKIFKPVLRKKNIGVIPNSIETLKLATGTYIALCEGDDYWTDPNKLQLQADFLDKHKDYSLCFHPVSVVYEKNENGESIWPRVSDKSKLTVKALLQENFVPTNAVMFRRQNYDHLPTNVMPLDWYLHLYHAQFGKIGFISRTMSVYRRHAAGVWWDAENNKSLFWEKYALPHTAMYLELLKIYGHDAALRNTIYESLSRALTELVEVETRDKKHFLEQVVTQYPESAEIFMHNAYRLRLKHERELSEQQAEIKNLNQDIVDLRADIFKLKDELHALKNSRVLGKIIKVRNKVGAARGSIKQVAHPIHQARVVLAPYVPAKARKRIKHVVRRGRNYIRQGANSAPLRYETVVTEAWDPKRPLVSVVIPYYNLAETIDDTLASLETQTLQNFEVLIVDDGSPDGTSQQKLQEIEKIKPSLRIIRQSNQGVAAARNNGIQQTKGKYVVCLDADDMLDPTFLEKAVTVLETQPDISIVTTWMDTFGVITERFEHVPYDPLKLYKNNMVITAAMFRREAWDTSGGYKSNIGYEDWDYWLSLAEHGHWARQIAEALFLYRTSLQSRYVEDKDIHWSNIKKIDRLHPGYKTKIRALMAKRHNVGHVTDPMTGLRNLKETQDFLKLDTDKPNILITIPWMTFGGAETLIYNYCREIKDDFNLSFVTGLKSDNEWEYKFKEITPRVYHLANLFDDPKLYIEFISNYITTRDIDILHVIHNGFTFEMLEELRRRHPDFKVIVTMFNDRVEYFEQSIGYAQFIDGFATDNARVAQHYQKKLPAGKSVTIIPNGINCYDEFSPTLFDRAQQRAELKLSDDEQAVFFVGRLSVEKNPNVFVEVAQNLLVNKQVRNLKFFIIGDGPMKAEIVRELAKINNANLEYLGYQSEVARFFAAADIFVLPSSVEGFPLSILEAMAMNVVTVASDVGAVAEVVESGKQGFVVKPGSVPEISEAILKLSKDQKLLDSMKQAARKKVEDTYSNIILGNNYRDLYRKAIK